MYHVVSGNSGCNSGVSQVNQLAGRLSYNFSFDMCGWYKLDYSSFLGVSAVLSSLLYSLLSSLLILIIFSSVILFFSPWDFYLSLPSSTTSFSSETSFFYSIHMFVLFWSPSIFRNYFSLYLVRCLILANMFTLSYHNLLSLTIAI